MSGLSTLQWLLTNVYKQQMIDHIKNHPEDFDELIQLALLDKQPYSWRAAWLLWSCMEDNDERVIPYLQSIINILPKRNDNHSRELLIILQKIDRGEEFEGWLFNHCIAIWEQTNKRPAVRLNAFKLMADIAIKYPDLKKELTLFTQKHYMESLSLAVQKSINKKIQSI